MRNIIQFHMYVNVLKNEYLNKLIQINFRKFIFFFLYKKKKLLYLSTIQYCLDIEYMYSLKLFLYYMNLCGMQVVYNKGVVSRKKKRQRVTFIAICILWILQSICV